MKSSLDKLKIAPFLLKILIPNLFFLLILGVNHHEHTPNHPWQQEEILLKTKTHGAFWTVALLLHWN